MSTGRRTRGWQRDKVLALVLALLAVAVMAAALRVSEDKLDFQVVTGTVDEQIPIRGGLLGVSNVRVGTLLLKEGAVTSETQGMFVVIEVAVSATGNRDISIGSGTLLTADGFTYKPYDSASVRAVSGFRATDDAVFEVDPAHLDDLTAQLGESELVSGFQQRTRIHLGITAANAEQWRAAARDRGIEVRGLALDEALP